ncbi:YggS family pyridoxal phosphate enzyme [Xylogone sp. PMI_703]|nr:YggS family pyridoxal phosphate enzyme [Xylogone sp. PMI_703]
MKEPIISANSTALRYRIIINPHRTIVRPAKTRNSSSEPSLRISTSSVIESYCFNIRNSAVIMGSNGENMKITIDPLRAKALVANVQAVSKQVAKVAGGRNVRLVAVSKLKPASDILALYQSPLGITHFGENYAQELVEKASLLPDGINWHFIGGLQTNKCKPLASTIPNLFCVSSVDTLKKAQALDAGRAIIRAKQPWLPPLNIHVQVNTSGEESKSGITPGDETTRLCREIVSTCPNLRLAGLMTIGDIGRSQATGQGLGNEDFQTLKKEKNRLVEELGVEGLELSMGMSADFMGAIVAGSDEVRVGSNIFGTRPPKSEAVIV